MSRPSDPFDATTPPDRPTVGPGGSASRPPSSSTHHGRYLPGVVLCERYRIVDRIGRGGMGEVYRADDLKLDQVVALKFLPDSLEQNDDRLARLIVEVRLARQVSHPNLCRVYDIDQADGRHFLTMEYVDGEDLESLLRRIGHLPREKALEIARQLCAGLAAAHDQKILHRDLKPANVMIDGRGRARITDFGLAIADADAHGREIQAGTPAYMAPEQWAGREVTQKSDLYALGLVLYELFTGRRAFEAATMRELGLQHSEVAPRPPSSLVEGFDPAIERAILRCLEKDPQARPSSALAVAASLPGGDPLAAALAAGETPSPEVVAASGGEGSLRRGPALALLGVFGGFLAAILAIAPASTDLGLAPPMRSPVILVDQAQRILAGIGASTRPADTSVALERDYDRLRYALDLDPSPVARAHHEGWGVPLLLRYRQSPEPMVPRNVSGHVLIDDPPHEQPGMATVVLSGSGRLRRLRVVVPLADSTWTSAAARTADSTWTWLFAEAGLERDRFTEVATIWANDVAFDERREWTGVAPWDARVPLRVSVAAWQGRPVSFALRGPWNQPGSPGLLAASTTLRISAIVNGILIAFAIAFSVWMAQRNLRSGRGDRSGAMRFGLFLSACSFVGWLASAHHVAELVAELNQISIGAAAALGAGAMLAVIYLAFEPYARRIMPEGLIGWARAVDGQWRDPRIGRDVLLGLAAGTFIAFTFHLTNAIPTWFPFKGQTPIGAASDTLLGGYHLVAFFAGRLNDAVGTTITMFGILMLARLLLRRAWLAQLVLTILILLNGLGGENFALELPGQALIAIVWATILARHGLLASLAYYAVFLVLVGMPLVTAAGAPTTGTTWLLLAGLVGMAITAFRIARGSAGSVRTAVALERAA